MTGAEPLARRGDDERRHHPRGADWSEEWVLDLVDADGAGAVLLRIVVHPDLGQAWYLAFVVRPGEPIVTVADLDVPVPASAASLELRTSGLWADYNVETPFDHVSIGLEAFGVALDHPRDVFSGGFGTRTPVGFDLEWETVGSGIDVTGNGGYALACRAHGEILLGAETVAVDGGGTRAHAWGPLDWWGTAAPRARLVRPDGTLLAVDGPGALTVRADADGFPAGGTLRPTAESFGDPFDLTVLAVAPALLTGPDGRRSRLVSALVEATDRTGRPCGTGWIETLAPAP